MKLSKMTRHELTALADRDRRMVPYAPHLASALRTDYASLGAELATASAVTLRAFAETWGTSLDTELRAIAAWARFKADAADARFAGNSNRAALCEERCEREYRTLKPENRW